MPFAPAKKPTSWYEYHLVCILAMAILYRQLQKYLHWQSSETLRKAAAQWPQLQEANLERLQCLTNWFVSYLWVKDSDGK